MDIYKSSLKITIAKFGGHLLSFVGIAYFARQIGANQLGVFFLFQALIGILVLFSNLGTRIAVEKRISEGGGLDSILGSAIVLKSILLIPVIIIIALGRHQINQYVGEAVSIFLILMVIFHNFAGLMISVLKGELRVGETATLQIAFSVTWVGTGALLLEYGFGVKGLITAVIIGKVVQLIWASKKITVGYGVPTREHIYSLIGYAKFSIIPEVDSQVHSWVDVLIIGYILSQKYVGAYETAWRITGPILIISSSIATSIFPQISSWKAEGSLDAAEEELPKVILISTYFVMPSFFGGLLFSEEILGIIFGEGFTLAAGALVILLAGTVPRVGRQIAGKYLLGLNQPQLVTYSSALIILLNVVMNFILISKFGIIGAAVGTSSAMTIGTIILIKFLSEFITVSVPWKKLGWCLLSAIIMCLILYHIKSAVEISGLVELFSIIAGGGVVYLLLSFSYAPIREDMLY